MSEKMTIKCQGGGQLIAAGYGWIFSPTCPELPSPGFILMLLAHRKPTALVTKVRFIVVALPLHREKGWTACRTHRTSASLRSFFLAVLLYQVCEFSQQFFRKGNVCFHSFSASCVGEDVGGRSNYRWYLRENMKNCRISVVMDHMCFA